MYLNGEEPGRYVWGMECRDRDILVLHSVLLFAIAGQINCQGKGDAFSPLFFLRSPFYSLRLLASHYEGGSYGGVCRLSEPPAYSVKWITG